MSAAEACGREPAGGLGLLAREAFARNGCVRRRRAPFAASLTRFTAGTRAAPDAAAGTLQTAPAEHDANRHQGDHQEEQACCQEKRRHGTKNITIALAIANRELPGAQTVRGGAGPA